MSDIDAAFNRDTCKFGVAGARYCTRYKEARKRIAELEQQLADCQKLLKEASDRLVSGGDFLAKEQLVESLSDCERRTLERAAEVVESRVVSGDGDVVFIARNAALETAAQAIRALIPKE